LVSKIGVFGCNLGYLLEVIHMFKSASRNVDAALVQENEILIFNLHGTAPIQITSISAEEHLEDQFSRIPANVCPFTISELWCEAFGFHICALQAEK
jgi:hypothetical protein